MIIYKFKVTQSRVMLVDKSDIVTSGNINQIKCKFEMSEEFEGMNCRAVFNNEYRELVDGECFAPELDCKMCTIGVYGYYIEDGKTVNRISPEPCSVIVHKGSYNHNAVEAAEPSPTELEALHQKIVTITDKHNSDISEVNGSIKMVSDLALKNADKLIVVERTANRKQEVFSIGDGLAMLPEDNVDRFCLHNTAIPDKWQKLVDYTSTEELAQFSFSKSSSGTVFDCDRIRAIISIPKVKKAFSGFIKYAPDEMVYWDDEEEEDVFEHIITPYSEKSWTSTATDKTHIFEADLNGRLELMSITDAMYMINGKPAVAWYQPTYASASERPHIIGYDSMIQSLGYILIGCDEGCTYPAGTHIQIFGINYKGETYG